MSNIINQSFHRLLTVSPKLGCTSDGTAQFKYVRYVENSFHPGPTPHFGSRFEGTKLLGEIYERDQKDYRSVTTKAHRTSPNLFDF